MDIVAAHLHIWIGRECPTELGCEGRLADASFTREDEDLAVHLGHALAYEG